MTDTELDTVYTPLCKTMTRLGEPNAPLFLARFALLAIDAHRRRRGRAAADRRRRRRSRARADQPDARRLRHDPRSDSKYQSGFANEFATEALPGALPDRAQLAAARAVRPVRRTAVGHRVHRAAARQPALVAVPHPPGGDARAVRAHRRRAASSAASTRCRRRPTSCAGIRCRCRPSRPTSSTAWSRWPATPAARSTCTRPTARWSDRCFYDADGELLIVPQQGAPRPRHRARRARGRAAGDRGRAARRSLPGAPAGRHGARLRLRELRRAVPSARPRRDRLERPGQPARLPARRWPPTKTAKASSSSSPSSRATSGARASATRRSTS